MYAQYNLENQNLFLQLRMPPLQPEEADDQTTLQTIVDDFNKKQADHSKRIQDLLRGNLSVGDSMRNKLQAVTGLFRRPGN